jgi:glycosyltransferase involved in cell wall biosynthesis
MIIPSKADYILMKNNKSDNIVLSIIIPVFNNVNFTQSLLNDLFKLPNTHEIIIVDNGSSDDTQDTCFDFLNKSSGDPNLPRFVYLGQSCNLGFGRANNKGYRESAGKNILFLNNDVRVQKDYDKWSEELIKMCGDGYIVSTQAGLLDKNFNYVREGIDISLFNYVREGIDISLEDPLSYLSGWFIGASRETFDKLILGRSRDNETNKMVEEKSEGPWNELYELYFEDDDLTFRARELKISMAMIKVPLFHFGRMTGKKYNMLGKYHESRALFLKEWLGKV